MATLIDPILGLCTADHCWAALAFFDGQFVRRNNDVAVDVHRTFQIVCRNPFIGGMSLGNTAWAKHNELGWEVPREDQCVGTERNCIWFVTRDLLAASDEATC